jgi:hypothetical protein
MSRYSSNGRKLGETYPFTRVPGLPLAFSGVPMAWVGFGKAESEVDEEEGNIEVDDGLSVPVCRKVGSAVG